MISDQMFKNAVMLSNSISDTTKITYLKHMRQVKRYMAPLGATFYALLLKPREVLLAYQRLVQNKTISLSTAKSNITVLGSLIRRLKELKTNPSDFAQVENQWVGNMKEMSTVMQHKVEENTLSEREKKAWVSYPEWYEMTTKLEQTQNGSPQQLLVAFHCLISPPRGGDLAQVRFVTEDEHTTDNTLVWNGVDKPAQLLIRDHKTSSKIPLISQELPLRLKESIQMSLSLKPRKYLFEDATSGLYNRDAFSQWKNREFKKLFGKPATTNIARHAYITYFDQSNSIQQQRVNAGKMGHSLQTHNEYKKLV